MKSMFAGLALVLTLSASSWGQDPNVPAPAPAPAPPVAPNANNPNRFQGRVELLDKDKVIIIQYNRGDSIDKPTGKREELAITEKTKFFNIRAKEINDEDVKQKILGKGQVVLVNIEEKDGKRIATSLQAVGG